MYDITAQDGCSTKMCSSRALNNIDDKNGI